MRMIARRWQVRTQRPIAYDVIESPHLFDPASAALLAFGRPGGRRFVVVDAEVARHYGTTIRAFFDRHRIEARIAVFPGGEEHKSVEAWQDILRALDAFPIHRRDEPIIAIGGGVLTDVVAYAAASYRRGVPHLKVPTTLMGYIDAALGIKAGVNFNGNKNRLGCFEPPLAVLLDKSFLRTLPRRHLLNGVCEIIKLAIVRDAGLFAALEAHAVASVDERFQNSAGDAILDAAIGGMLEELAPNLYEEELARKVDFGHTFSYGLEARHAHRLLHGEAVLLDILVSVAIAERRGLLAARDVLRVFALVEELDMGLDGGLLDGAAMWRSLIDRVEHRNGLQRVPLPAGIGDCIFVNHISRAELDAALSALRTRIRMDHEPALER
jgi:3-dehydroquinate synthase